MRCLPSLALALALAACSGGGVDATPDAGYNCDLETRDEPFVAGMSKTGARGVTFTLVSSDPAPPARDDNAWVIDVADAGGPLVDATLSVRPFMPDHNHGTSIRAVITPDPTTPGRYAASPVNLFMPGLWEITVGAVPSGGGAADQDTVVFRFCVGS